MFGYVFRMLFPHGPFRVKVLRQNCGGVGTLEAFVCGKPEWLL